MWWWIFCWERYDIWDCILSDDRGFSILTINFLKLIPQSVRFNYCKRMPNIYLIRYLVFDWKSFSALQYERWDSLFHSSKSNPIFWIHGEIHPSGESLDVFHYKSRLPDNVICAVLAKTYKARCEWSNAINAFSKALEAEPDNLWLKGVIHDLDMIFTELNRETRFNIIYEMRDVD